MKLQIILIGLLLISFVFAVSAQDNGANSAQNGKVTEEAEIANQIFLAYQVAKFGEAKKSPDALIFAASILKTTAADQLDLDKQTEGGQSDAATKTAKPELTADNLLKQAKILARGDKNLLGRIAAVAKMIPGRGAVNGPRRGATEVKAYQTDVITLSFKGGENGVVTISGDGDTDLDLYIYDEKGNLVGSDTGGSDDCRVRFFPKWNGNFKIKVKNLGNRYNHYTLVTN